MKIQIIINFSQNMWKFISFLKVKTIQLQNLSGFSNWGGVNAAKVARIASYKNDAMRAISAFRYFDVQFYISFCVADAAESSACAGATTDGSTSFLLRIAINSSPEMVSFS